MSSLNDLRARFAAAPERPGALSLKPWTEADIKLASMSFDVISSGKVPGGIAVSDLRVKSPAQFAGQLVSTLARVSPAVLRHLHQHTHIPKARAVIERFLGETPEQIKKSEQQ